MIPADQACAILLVFAAFVAFVGAVVMVGGVYEGRRWAAWGGAAMFATSSLGAAWCFGRLV